MTHRAEHVRVPDCDTWRDINVITVTDLPRLQLSPSPLCASHKGECDILKALRWTTSDHSLKTGPQFIGGTKQYLKGINQLMSCCTLRKSCVRKKKTQQSLWEDLKMLQLAAPTMQHGSIIYQAVIMLQ